MYRTLHDPEWAAANGHENLHKKYRNFGYGTAASMQSDGRIRPNKIKDIRYAGRRETLKITTSSGADIVCTWNHKFPTPLGERYADDLRINDQLYESGVYEKCTKAYRYNDPSLKDEAPSPQGYYSWAIYMATREKYKEHHCPCEICGRPYTSRTRFELHHKDLNRYNGDESNLQWLCVSCHKKAHYAAGRTTRMRKGIPTIISTIVSIEKLPAEDVYDVEMEAPYHNFVTCTGIVTSNSHAYCVALDSLYGAWLKAHHPLEFYETYLTMQNEKGDKDKMADAKDEAERYFSIKFPPFRFGQDNRSIHAVPEERSITNPLSAIKGFGSAVGEILYECGQEKHKNFTAVLRWLDERGIKSSKTIPLIKIDYFDQFGSCRKLLTIAELFDYLKQGNSKQLARDKVPELIAPILEKHATYKNAKGAELKSYIITDMDGLLDDLESYVLGSDMPELDFRVKAQNQLDVLGYVDLTTGRKEDLRKLFIVDIYPLKSKQDGSIWTYKLKTKSLGSGKVASLDVRPREFSSHPLRKGDIIYAADVAKDKKGYWRLTQYSVLV